MTTKHLDKLLDEMEDEVVDGDEVKDDEGRPESIDERLRRLEELVGGL